jgi:Cu(I)/Ag(I) efflux system membrane fusion protein
VETGPAAGDQVEIRKGLSAGDEVVTGASFLVDSESRLRAALAQMTAKAEPATPATPAPDHKH